MLKKMNHHIVLITGASSGIGKALAIAYAGAGARVVITARRKEMLTELARELDPSGDRVLVAQADVTKDGDLEAAVSAARSKWQQGISIAIANAGFSVVGSFSQLKIEDYRRQFETNVFGVLRTVKAVLPDLRESRGQLAIIGSVAGFASLPGGSPYGMSKFAVRCLSESLYQELRHDGIHVTHIAPGFVVSEIRNIDNQGSYNRVEHDPIPRWLQMPTNRAAAIIVRAIACKRREVVVTGHGIVAVFLSKHFAWLYHALLRVIPLKARSHKE